MTRFSNPLRTLSAIGVAVALAVAGSAAFAQGKGQGGGQGGGQGNKPPGGETAGNNISFPLILSDNVGPTLPADAAWTFATITDPQNQCIGEEGTATGNIDPTILCYHGRKVTVVSETGEIQFSGEPKTWWLQKRPQNLWKALVVGRADGAAPLAVSAVDIGDLLESQPEIGSRKVRTEFNLLQHVESTDPEFGDYVVPAWNDGVPYPCEVPTTAAPVGCFAALAMSGAVPGTEQSGTEMQGTDFGPGTNGSADPGTQTLLDPTIVRTTTPEVGGIHAVVYSRCARLVIQRITGQQPTWNPTLGYWDGASAPVVNVAAYNNQYNAEINSGGSIVYGYNWSTSGLLAGTYRLTFVLDGNDDEGPACTTPLLTKFDGSATQMVNVGENNPGQIVFAGDPQLGDEGGLAYVDVPLVIKGGGRGR